MMNLNQDNQSLALDLKREELEEIRIFLSLYANDKNMSSASDTYDLLKHPVFVKPGKRNPVNSSTRQVKKLPDIPEKITFKDNWIEYLRNQAPGNPGECTPDTDFTLLDGYAMKVRDFCIPVIVQHFKNNPDKLIMAIKGMDRFIDMNTYLIGRAILKEKQQLVDEQRLKNAKINDEFEQFVYTVSHDLQQPLTTLISISSLLEDEFPQLLEGECSDYVRYIGKASDRLSSMVSDLLDHSRIGRWSTIQKVDLNKVVKDVLGDLKDDIKKTGAKIHVAELPSVNAYPVEIRFLFKNLISNALTFRKKDAPPVITISSKKENNNWHFTVADNGIGIEEKSREKVFIIFQKLHNLSDYNGNGSGLAHCKKIAMLHGGDIWVDSKPGSGSKFHFTICTNNLL